MREIKFRAWDTSNQNMYVTELEAIAFAKSGNPANASVVGFSKPLIAIGDNPQILVMQFTGLKDKNGKEIYEGDIVRTGKFIGQVEWLEYRWDVADFYAPSQDNPGDAFSEAAWEVIGNIYEHPHLLKA